MRKVFLDLEGTLIDDWQNLNFLSDKAKFIFKQLLPSDELHIFSFAIWDIRDLARFNFELRFPLENLFTASVQVHTRDEIKSIICKFRNLVLSSADFSGLFTKELAFIDFIRATETSGTFVLFDDTVSNWQIKFADLEIFIISI